MTPKSVHRGAAALEMITWTLLIGAMILRYAGVTENLVSVAGPVHGFGFLCFAAITVVLWVNNRWPLLVGIVGLVVSVIPFAAVPFTLWADRKRFLEGSWRYLRSEDTPQSLPDKVLAQLVRHPVRTIVVLLVLITIVFTLLLMIGQPYDPVALYGK